MINIKRLKNIVLFLICLLGIIAFSLFTISCDPNFDIIIENQTSQNLTVYINKDKVGTVEPGKQIVAKNAPGSTWTFLTTAENMEQEIIFSQNLTRPQMQRINETLYKIVIPPPKEE